MADIYNDSTYLKNNPTWHEEDAVFKSEKIVQLLNRNHIHFNTICEIGCGSGEILVQLAAKLREDLFFWGFDISNDAIKIAKTKETDRIKFRLQNIAETTQSYDLLLVIDVVEHIENYFQFLEDVVNKGKYTIFHIPLDICVWSLFKEKILIHSKEKVGHIHNFTEEFIESILLDKGFEIIDKFYTEPVYEAHNFKQKFVKTARNLLYKIDKRFCTKTIGGYSILLLAENHKKIQI